MQPFDEKTIRQILGWFILFLFGIIGWFYNRTYEADRSGESAQWQRIAQCESSISGLAAGLARHTADHEAEIRNIKEILRDRADRLKELEQANRMRHP